VKHLLLVTALIAGCGETGLERVSFPIHAAGTGETTFESDGWSVTIERAELGFGPIYFCATSFADVDVCPQAEAEWLGSSTIDALDPAPVMLGEAQAVTATVRSAMFDYGRTWLATDERASAGEGAPQGHSAVFELRATRDGTDLEVHAEVDVDPGAAGQSAILGAQVGTHEITGREALTVRFDPSVWLSRLDVERVLALDDEGDGVVVLAPGDPDYEALVIAMSAGSLPSFEWTEEP
jgi:hypothetical protein